MDSELLRLAQQTSQKTILETAEYFVEKQDWESAMMLYHKVESCLLRIWQFEDTLQQLVIFRQMLNLQFGFYSTQGGKQKKALEICMEANLVASLESILHDVNTQGDHHLLLDAADVLLLHGDFENATKLLLKANQPDKALAMCIQHDVPMNEV